MIYVRKLKKKCMIRGCGNTESFALTRSSSETGNVYICASCLAEGLSQVDEARKKFNAAEKVKKVSSPAPLFYHPELKVPAMNVQEAPFVMPSEVVVEENLEAGQAEAAEETVYEVVDVNSVDGAYKEQSGGASDAIDEEKKHAGFICTECGRGFDTLKGLNAHAKVHKE